MNRFCRFLTVAGAFCLASGAFAANPKLRSTIAERLPYDGLTVAGERLLSSSLVSPMTVSEKWCFVVAGDGRSDPGKNRREDKDGVNVTITAEIAQAVLQEKARFMLWTGDLVVGALEPKTFETQLLRWRSLMAPLYAAKVGVYPVRGNHESYSNDALATWDKVFSGPYLLPRNGSSRELNLSYYVQEGPVLAIGLDQYVGAKETVNQRWLDDVLKEHRKPFVFVYGHEPAFMDGAHKDTMDAHPENRDAFWKSLIAAGCRVFFTGHDHLYDHMVITQKGAKPGPELHQFVAGTAGAPFYSAGSYQGANTDWKLKRIRNITRTYGYMLVEVEDDKVSITFKGRTSPGVYVPMDGPYVFHAATD